MSSCSRFTLRQVRQQQPSAQKRDEVVFFHVFSPVKCRCTENPKMWWSSSTANVDPLTHHILRLYFFFTVLSLFEQNRQRIIRCAVCAIHTIRWWLFAHCELVYVCSVEDNYCDCCQAENTFQMGPPQPLIYDSDILPNFSFSGFLYFSFAARYCCLFFFQILCVEPSSFGWMDAKQTKKPNGISWLMTFITFFCRNETDLVHDRHVVAWEE